jgi:8-oxo-dGTP pyrophosphatase MutT (NUDIX family)
MTVREDDVERPDGSRGTYGVVSKPDFAVVIPVDGEYVYLVEQYRYPVAERFWEFPQGSLEGTPDASPQEVARQELLEESGLLAAELRHIGRLYAAYGYSNQGFDVFVATGLARSNPQPAPEEHDLVSARFEVNRFEAMIAAGEVRDAPTVAAWYLLQHQDGFA